MVNWNLFFSFYLFLGTEILVSLEHTVASFRSYDRDQIKKISIHWRSRFTLYISHTPVKAYLEGCFLKSRAEKLKSMSRE